MSNMDKATYRASTTEERIKYLNSEMASDKKLCAICKEIGIADNITTEFRKKGYVRNKEGLFVKHEEQQPDQVSSDQLPGATELQEAAESEEGSIITEEIKPLAGEIVPPLLGISDVITAPTSGVSEKDPQAKKVGRPPREGEKPKKLTVEIDPAVYRALMHYKVDSGIYVNAYLEELIKANVPEKYFAL